MNGQGGIDEGSIDGVDEAIDSRASMAAVDLEDQMTEEAQERRKRADYVDDIESFRECLKWYGS